MSAVYLYPAAATSSKRKVLPVIYGYLGGFMVITGKQVTEMRDRLGEVVELARAVGGRGL